MKITGELKVHKSDGVTRPVRKARVMKNGALAVWDEPRVDANKLELIKWGEPDIIVSEEKWERIERDGHHWRHTSSRAVMEEARKRDDVDEDEVAEML